MKEAETFVKKHAEQIHSLYKKAQAAYWDASITGDENKFAEYAETVKKIKAIHNKKEDFELIKNFLLLDHNEILKRQLEILYAEYLSSQGDINLINEIISLESKIEQKFNTFRAKVGEKEFTDNQIKDILKSETDSEKLKQAWGASKKQGEIVEKDLIHLAKLRNELAKSNGFENFYVMSLEASEQKESEIIKIFDKLYEQTKESFGNLKKEIDSSLAKKYKINEGELKPWHYQDLFFQEGPQIYEVDLDGIYEKVNIIEIAKDYYSKIGFNISPILEKSDLYEKKGKSQHAFCIDMDREGDVRILQNIKNNEKWMETTLHELGHAIYSSNIDRSLPFILRDSAHTLTTEAIAMLFGRENTNPTFLKEYCELSEEKITELAEKLFKAKRLRQLVFARWAQVMVRFEGALYKNPDQDLNKLWWQLVKKYQLIDFERDKPDWASKVHFTIAPIYYHNYVFGELFASQLHHHVLSNFLKTNSKNYSYLSSNEISNFLKNEIFIPGKKYRWDKLIEKSTREQLNPAHFVKEFCDNQATN